ncbi:MAG: class I SAM-dependent methyltransferase [Planctomycetota bacterium]
MKTHTAPHPGLAAGVTTCVECRICGVADLLPVLDLHEQAVGNAFRQPGGTDPLRAPLQLVRCASCSFVQLAHIVDSEVMYSSYWYRSGINHTMRRHLEGLAEQAIRIAGVRAGDTVIDIGCNDGTTLACYPESVHRIGVDPSNIQPEGCDVHIHDYFSHNAVAAALNGGRAKVITSIAMFYDLNEPRPFVEDVRRCLADDGVWIVELSYLPAMLKAVSYDTICHEHVGYYRIKTFESVLDGTDLEVFDVEFNECNGGSFRLFTAPRGTRQKTERYVAAKFDEFRQLFDTAVPYTAFEKRVEHAGRELRAFLENANRDGKVVYGYGASTKGMVTLQYCGVTPDHIVAIAERNPDKFGLLCPGTDIPICSEAEMRAASPDYLVVLPWHFLTEFLEREQDYLAAGGKLVVPMPDFAIHSADEALA